MVACVMIAWFGLSLPVLVLLVERLVFCSCFVRFVLEDEFPSRLRFGTRIRGIVRAVRSRRIPTRLTVTWVRRIDMVFRVGHAVCLPVFEPFVLVLSS